MRGLSLSEPKDLIDEVKSSISAYDDRADTYGRAVVSHYKIAKDSKNAAREIVLQAGDRGGDEKHGGGTETLVSLPKTTSAEIANVRLQSSLTALEVEQIHVLALVERMKQGVRWAHQLYAKYRRDAGTSAPLAEKIANALGTSLEVAKGALEIQRAANAAADPRILLEQAESYLQRRYTETPALAYRSPLRRLLLDLDASYAPNSLSANDVAASSAVVVEDGGGGAPRGG